MKKLFFVAAVAALCGLGSCSSKGHCNYGTYVGPTYSGSTVDAAKLSCSAGGWLMGI